MVRIGSTLIADLSYPNGGASHQECDNLNCYDFPLQGSKWNTDLTAAQQAETTVFADFGVANTGGGPYAVAY